MARKKRGSGARYGGGSKGGKPAILALTAKKRPAKSRVGKITLKGKGTTARKRTVAPKVAGRKYVKAAPPIKKKP